MKIYEPDIFLSETDRELLALLGQLVLAQHGHGDNVDRSEVALSPSEARDLLRLLEEFVESKLFYEGSYFVEGMANGNAWRDDALREIYLSWRKTRGRSRMMASRHWNEFVLRAGFQFSEKARMFAGGPMRSPVRPMPTDHFSKMELRLAKSANIHPRVADLIMQLVEKSRSEIDDLRAGNTKVAQGILRSRTRIIADRIREAVKGTERKPVSKFELVTVTTIVMDSAALFTTRDWTAAGVLSNIAAVSCQSLD